MTHRTLKAIDPLLCFTTSYRGRSVCRCWYLTQHVLGVSDRSSDGACMPARGGGGGVTVAIVSPCSGHKHPSVTQTHRTIGPCTSVPPDRTCVKAWSTDIATKQRVNIQRRAWHLYRHIHNTITLVKRYVSLFG